MVCVARIRSNSRDCQVWNRKIYFVIIIIFSDTLPNLLNIFSSPSPFLLPSDKLQRVSSLFQLLSSSLVTIVTIPSYASPSFHVVDHALKSLTRVLRECRDSDKDISVCDDVISCQMMSYHVI